MRMHRFEGDCLACMQLMRNAGQLDRHRFADDVDALDRWMLAGSHPLLLLVADLLAGWPAVPGHFRLLAQSAAALRNLQRRGVPVRFGALVLRAQGDDAVQQVTLCDADDEWNARPGTERVHQADTLVG